MIHVGKYTIMNRLLFGKPGIPPPFETIADPIPRRAFHLFGAGLIICLATVQSGFGKSVKYPGVFLFWKCFGKYSRYIHLHVVDV